MSITISGLHHVTAMAGRAQAAIEYYVRLLGLRLVKRTVNFDDPLTYHLYFGDARGNPGSVLSLFPWPGVGPAERGGSETTAVTFRVPPGALEYWRSTLELHRQPFEVVSRFGTEVIAFADPDGVPLELVEGTEPPAPAAPLAAPAASTQAGPQSDGATHAGVSGEDLTVDLLRPSRYWTGSPVDAEEAIMGLDAVTLSVWDPDAAVSTLTDVLGLELSGEEDGRHRLNVKGASNGLGSRLDVVRAPQSSATRLGTGSVHHVAFRVADKPALVAAREVLLDAGLHPTNVKDRQYFQSVYFKDPNGVVLELATDGPGFTVDESLDELGLAFKLPGWLEPERQFFRSRLPVTASPEYADRFGAP